MPIRFPCKTLVASIALATIVTGCGDAPSGDEAETEEPAVIDERQTNFEEIGDAFKAIRGQRDNETPDFALIAASAETIKANAAKIAGHFPEGTGMEDGFDTEALATIWQSPDDFAAAADNLATKGATLAEAASAGDVEAVAAAVKELGGTCKTCHDTFRLDKDE